MLDELESDNSIGCVILTGRGRAFAAGADQSSKNFSKLFEVIETSAVLFRISYALM